MLGWLPYFQKIDSRYFYDEKRKTLPKLSTLDGWAGSGIGLVLGSASCIRYVLIWTTAGKGCAGRCLWAGYVSVC